MEKLRLEIRDFLNNYGKVVLVFLIIIITFLQITFIFSITQTDKLKVVFFDIGQGDAIFIETPSKKKVLIDGGPNNLILEKLSSELSFFDKKIDMIIATHPDSDHITGLIPTLNKYEVENIVTQRMSGITSTFGDLEEKINKETYNEKESQKIFAKSGDTIDFQDGVTAKILWPSENFISKKGDTNSSSVTLELIYKDMKFLLTGDLPKEEESRIINSSLSKNITVYKAGHHGSNTSSGETLLTYIKPEYSIISAGKDNRYGHPSGEALERLKKYSKEIISTIDHGNITFVTDGKVISVKKEK